MSENAIVRQNTSGPIHMRQIPVTTVIAHPRFAAYYNWMTLRPQKRRKTDPWRREIVGLAHGIVLEVGAGGGQNFPFYDPSHVVRVEAVEPDTAMLAYAAGRTAEGAVPIHLTRAAVESLPFPDASFDSAIATLVFCSVADPARGFDEIWRTLKPGGTLLLLEHVRSHDARVAWIQDALVPLTTRIAGNCHWNRDTPLVALGAGFQMTQTRQVRGGLEPVLLMQAKRPEPPRASAYRPAVRQLGEDNQ